MRRSAARDFVDSSHTRSRFFRGAAHIALLEGALKTNALIIIFCAIWGVGHRSGVAQTVEEQSSQGAVKAKQESPPIKRLDQDRALVGEVLVNRKTRRVEVPAEVNMTKGILEYYAVCDEGKLHESILKVNAVPSHIHLALILAGYEPSEYGPPEPETRQRRLKKKGSLVRLYIKWRPEEIDREQWVPAEAWLYQRETDSPPQSFPYIFEGSVIDQNGYLADRFKSVIGLIDDSTVVLSPTTDQGNPYRGDQLGFEVYSSSIPPKGTAVTLVIQAAGPKEIAEVARYEQELSELQEIKRARIAERNKRRPLPFPPPFELNLYINARSALSYQSDEGG